VSVHIIGTVSRDLSWVNIGTKTTDVLAGPSLNLI
jgi:hypothetical protein